MIPAMYKLSVFQSTLPREERQIRTCCLIRLRKYFNPRSHERSDVLKQMIDIAGYISIHAPTRGATKHLKGAETVEKFQSTLPREERQNVEQYIQRLSDFNPRSHERSD